MKQLVVLLFILPLFSTAQKIDIGINTGICSNLAPKVVQSQYLPKIGFVYDLKAAVSSLISLRAVADMGTVQISTGMDAYQVKHPAVIVTFPGPHASDFKQGIVYFANPAVVPNILLNIKMKFNGQYLYAGAGGGALLNPFKQRTNTNSNKYLANGTGLMYQFQVGFTKHMKKHLSLNAEVALRRNDISWIDEIDRNKAIAIDGYSVLTTLGVRYRLVGNK
jgi:hypothetical protein